MQHDGAAAAMTAPGLLECCACPAGFVTGRDSDGANMSPSSDRAFTAAELLLRQHAWCDSGPDLDARSSPFLAKLEDVLL